MKALLWNCYSYANEASIHLAEMAPQKINAKYDRACSLFTDPNPALFGRGRGGEGRRGIHALGESKRFYLLKTTGT